MNSLSPLVAWLLVTGTFAIGVVFSVQQWRCLRSLPGQTDLSLDDATYLRRQAYRRLVGCGLLFAIATMIAGSYIGGLEERADRLGNELRAKAEAGDRDRTPEQDDFKRTYASYWIAVLLLLFALLVVAAIDLYAIRRFSARHMKRIRDDRKAMIEQELAAYRRERARRNGSNGTPQ
ncbi:MAG: hypothetical protein U0746_00590 [Gemmataceae bacterium]